MVGEEFVHALEGVVDHVVDFPPVSEVVVGLKHVHDDADLVQLVDVEGSLRSFVGSPSRHTLKGAVHWRCPQLRTIRISVCLLYLERTQMTALVQRTEDAVVAGNLRKRDEPGVTITKRRASRAKTYVSFHAVQCGADPKKVRILI